MLDYKILANKSIETINGRKMYDLLSGSFTQYKEGNGQMIMVNKYYVARPDLISLAVYGSDEYADILCKVNGISNPFEMNEDDLLFLPDIDFIRECSKIKKNFKNDFIKDEDNDEIINKVSSYQKLPSDNRTPNQQLVGEENFVIDKSLGLVFY